MAKKEDKSDVLTLFEIKTLVEKGSMSFGVPEYEEDPQMTRIHSDIEDLNTKFEELKDIIVGVKKNGDSPRKLRMKKEIITLLKKNKKMNPTQLAKAVGLSRVRANEYLRELEEECIAQGIIVDKKKYYMLAADDLAKNES